MSIVEVHNLSKQFGSHKVLQDISFSIEQGEIFGYLGPNGAGKSTTLRCIMDFIHPSSGAISLLGNDAQTDSVVLKNDIGYVPAEPILYADLTGRQHINFINNSSSNTMKYAHELSEIFSFDTTKKVKELSTGNQQKLALILALARRPKLLILDEPTRGLDPLLRSVLHTVLRKYQTEGGTVLLSSHDLSEVEELCSRVAIIREGKLVKDTTIDKLRQEQGHIIKARFEGTVPDFTGSHVVVTSSSAHSVQCLVKGDLQPILSLLAKNHVKELQVNSASLEDIFMEMYT